MGTFPTRLFVFVFVDNVGYFPITVDPQMGVILEESILSYLVRIVAEEIQTEFV